MRTLLLPILLGLSLSGIGAALVYLALRRDEETNSGIRTSRQTVIEMRIPKECIGAVIGRQGCNIKNISEKSGARINFKDRVLDAEFQICTIRGTPESAQLAESMIHEFIMNQPLIVSHEMWVPQRACGRIIGKHGETIRGISSNSSARITVDSGTSDPDRYAESRIIIKGTTEQIAVAQSLIEMKVQEDGEMRQKMEQSIAHRSPRKQPKDSHNFLMAPLQEQGEELTQRTERLQTSGNDGCIDVFVSALENPGQFWVQLVTQRGVELDQLEDKMTEYYSKPENRQLHSVSELVVGQIVAAPFSNDHKWYRSEVLMIKPDEYDPGESDVTLYYVDYGDSCVSKQKETCELRTDFLTLYFQAIECFLANVQPKGENWSTDAIDLFEELAQVAQWRKKLAQTICYRPGLNKKGKRSGSPIPGIELHDLEKNVNIGEELVKQGFAVWSKTDSAQEADTLASVTGSAKIDHVHPTLHCSSRNGDDAGLRKSAEVLNKSSSEHSVNAKSESNASDSAHGACKPTAAGDYLAQKDGDQESTDTPFSAKEERISQPNKLPIGTELPSKQLTSPLSGKYVSVTTASGGAQETLTQPSISSSGATGRTSLNGKSSTGSSSATFIKTESGKRQKSGSSFKPVTLTAGKAAKKTSVETEIAKKETVVLPEPLSDYDDDEDELGFSMG